MKIDVLNKEEEFFCVLQNNWTGPDSFIQWYTENEEFIDATLLKHGVIRFKKTGLKTNEDFQQFVSVANKKPIDYRDGNSPRTKLSSKIYTSTEYPAEEFISLHNELSYSSYFPKKIFFYCLLPATAGGETTILNGNTFIDKLDRQIMGDFFNRKIKYVRNLHGGQGMGPSWQETFETEDKAVLETFCQAHDIHWTWLDNNALRLEQLGPTTMIHPASGKKVWFNQSDQFHPSNNPAEVYEAMKFLYQDGNYPLNVVYEDGSEIPEAIFDHIRLVSRQSMIALPWEKEDLMLVDNLATLHGRNPFVGERTTLVSMS